MNIQRLARKAAVELVPVLLVLVAGYFADNAEEFGLSAGTVWVLLQMRRVARDASKGSPE